MAREREGGPSRRARDLDQRLLRIKEDIRRRWIELGAVLAEIQETLAYRELGFANFQQYVEDRLAVSSRWATYLVCMVRKARRFGIDANTVARLDISKSLEIFRVDDARKARTLIEQTAAENVSLKEGKRRVAVALGQSTEDEPPTRPKGVVLFGVAVGGHTSGHHGRPV